MFCCFNKMTLPHGNYESMSFIRFCSTIMYIFHSNQAHVFSSWQFADNLTGTFQISNYRLFKKLSIGLHGHFLRKNLLAGLHIYFKRHLFKSCSIFTNSVKHDRTELSYLKIRNIHFNISKTIICRVIQCCKCMLFYAHITKNIIGRSWCPSLTGHLRRYWPIIRDLEFTLTLLLRIDF